MFVPIDVIGAIKDAKKSEPKFVATPMPSRSFYSSKPLENLLVSTQKTVDGNRIKWSSYQKLIFKRHQPFSMDVTEYGAISNRTISFQAKNPVSTFSTTGLTYLNTDKHAISQPKYDDLQSLLKYVPAEQHEFYRSLKHDSDTLAKDYALADRQSSDDDDESSDEM